jgi:hypothetical protein
MADTRRPAVEGRPVQGAPPEGPAEPIFRRGQGAPSLLNKGGGSRARLGLWPSEGLASNPYLPREEPEKLERENVPLVYQQRVSRRVRGLVRRRVLRPGQAPGERQACGGLGDLRWCVRDRGFGNEDRQRE